MERKSENKRPEDIIQVGEEFYVLVSSSLAEQRTRVLKQGDAFAVFDVNGDIRPIGFGAHGIFQGATRFLSKMELKLNEERPLLLSSSITNDNTLLTVDLMNADEIDGEGRPIERGRLHLLRNKFLWQGVCYEKLKLSHFGNRPVDVTLQFNFGCDFNDIFEVRGVKRQKRGTTRVEVVDKSRVVFHYVGLDDVERKTGILFSPEPKRLSETEVRFEFRVEPKSSSTVYSTVFLNDVPRLEAPTYDVTYPEVVALSDTARRDDTCVETSNEQFNQWISRSQADLHLMITKTSCGEYPYAGVPWFNTVFGRDGIITALQSLWINPSVAKGVLAYLSSTQGIADVPEQDCQPGKILHEVRIGEMVALGEVPFQRYYGSADATPLFVVLAHEYYRRTADLAFVSTLWESVQAALGWIDKYGDVDGDGFVEYVRRSPKGLTNQGWKDSGDAIWHKDGSLAVGPIALCEVQGYVYAAKKGAADLAHALGHQADAKRLHAEAQTLKEKFEAAYWCPEINTYAIALDGAKAPCRVVSSNPGHCLFSGIVDATKARALRDTLLSPQVYSGWGIRTVANNETNYNPMSYHNGSVWPHDTALVTEGLSRYGFKEEVLTIVQGMFEASTFLDLARLPELFCGFDRRVSEGPTLYPVACAPQAWAAGSVFMFLAACLGMRVDAVEERVEFHRPVLPSNIEKLCLKNLRVGKSKVDLLLSRHQGDVGINILQRDGDVAITIYK